MPEDQVVAALTGLLASVERVRVTLDAVEARAEHLRAGRGDGQGMRELVADEQRPLVVEMLTSILDDLAASGAAFRRAEARQLRDEGLSQEAIASLFGVTRQRIAVLLAAPPAGRGEAPAES